MLYRHAEHITWDRADDRVVVLDPDGSTLVTLNPLGSVLWSELDEPRETTELVERLHGDFPDVGIPQLTDDVETYLSSLLAEGLLVTVGQD